MRHRGRQGVVLMALVLLSCGGAVGSEAAAIGPEVQFFVDDVLIARREGVVRRVHACEKLDRPVLRADEPWERTDIDRRIYVYGTALRQEDGSGYRLWYNGTDGRLLCATSEDGIHWLRPNLGQVAYEGSTANDLLDLHIESPSVVEDPDPDDPARRYKLLGHRGGRGRGCWAAYSGEGLRWQFYTKNPVVSGGDTCTLAYDPEADEYLAFHKRSHDYRDATRRRLVYLAAWRLDGWCSLRADEAGGFVETVTLRSEGDRLLINADASNGSVVVAVRDSDGKALAGYGEADCVAVRGDCVRGEVRWERHRGPPKDRPVRLRFRLRKADLFG